MAQCEKRGVAFRFNTCAEAADVLATEPDEVIVATGGLPHTEVLSRRQRPRRLRLGHPFGRRPPGSNVLIYDDAGDHAGLQAADVIAATGASVEIVTPDRTFAPEVMAMNLVPYMRSLQTQDATFTVTWRLPLGRARRQPAPRHPRQRLRRRDHAPERSTRSSSTTAPGRSTSSTST